MSLLLASGGTPASSVVDAQGVDFDGVNDYLIRSTDLTGNVDSKTFTFSAWVYVDGKETRLYETHDGTSYGLRIYYIGSNIQLYGYQVNGNTVYRYNGSAVKVLNNTFTNILISFDLSDSLKHKWYINDIDVTPTPDIYSNVALNITASTHTVGNTAYVTPAIMKGRLSNVFLDYTYRDLSIEANRRLFITADGKPA